MSLIIKFFDIKKILLNKYMPKLVLIGQDSNKYTLESVKDGYFISSEKEWVALADPKEINIITSYPCGEISTPVGKRFLYNQTFRLKNDLDFIDTKPISLNHFTGIFDGNDKYILNIISNDDNFCGLFGSSKCCRIKNLKIKNCSINNNNNTNSCLIANTNSCDITKVSIEGKIILSGKHSGVVSSGFNGTCINIKIDIDSNISNLFYSYAGDFESSSINIRSTGGILFSKNFNGIINNCLFVYNSDAVICDNIIDGQITNNMFTFNISQFSNKENAQAFYNCVFNSNDETIYFNKNGEIVDKLNPPEWDDNYWTIDGKLKTFIKNIEV